LPRSDDGRWTRTCEVCGADYFQRKPGQRTCPPPKPCRARLPHNTGGARPKAGLEPRVCEAPGCPRGGEPFQPVRSSQWQCSRKCRDAMPERRAAQQQYDNSPGRRTRQNELRRSRAGDPRVREANRRANLRRYGITPEEYEAKLQAQNGRCMICGKPPRLDGVRAHSRLHQDHDHVTGANRDLLCSNCNSGLGYFQDDPELLSVAADYILRHRTSAAR
jgi:Recombination endonuclease VII